MKVAFVTGAVIHAVMNMLSHVHAEHQTWPSLARVACVVWQLHLQLQFQGVTLSMRFIFRENLYMAKCGWSMSTWSSQVACSTITETQAT